MESTTGLGLFSSGIANFDESDESDDHRSMYKNETVPGALVNPNNFTENYLNNMNSSYAISDTPISGLTYALFTLTCFVTVLGLFGNALILVVTLRRKTEPLKAHDILISALAVFDGIALASTAVSLPSVIDIVGLDIRAISNVGCKVFMSVFQPTAISSISIVVLICIERFIAVCLPFRAKQLLSPKRVSRCLGIVVGVISIVYVTMAILYSETDDGICDPNFSGKIYSSVLKRIPNTTFFIGILGLQLTICFIILLALTPMILVKLYQQNNARRQFTANERDNDNFQISVKLTSVVVVFLMFVALPNGIAIPIGLGGTQLSDTSKAGDILQWLSLLFLLNYSINFLLYSIFDSQFRKKALEIFGFVRESRPDICISRNAPAKTSGQRDTNQVP